METIAIGVDLGGTKIAFAAADHQGHILATHTEPTLPQEGVDAVIARIATGIGQVRVRTSDCTVAGIGIGAPGPVIDGVALNAVNLGWRDVPLVEKVQQSLRARQPAALDVPVWGQNDVKAGALGEMVFGAARGVRDFVYLAVGTGLGGASVANGRLISGLRGSATEVGHMSLDPHGRLCQCGNHGCVEMYVSGKGLLSGTREHLPNYPRSILAGTELTTRAILDAARAGDALALHVIEEAADALGLTMAWCATILDPALIVVGGGLAHAASDLLLERAEASMRARLMPDIAMQVTVVRSQVETSALGAAALVWHGLTSSDPA